MVGAGVDVGSRPLSGVHDGVGCCGSSDAIAIKVGWVKASRTAMIRIMMGKANRKILEGVVLFIFFSFEGTVT